VTTVAAPAGIGAEAEAEAEPEAESPGAAEAEAEAEFPEAAEVIEALVASGLSGVSPAGASGQNERRMDS
jgi:hypothetical protein